ncbi:MAG TPA: glycosyltransferase family 4 protein [Phycisphaerae bacterium]|nr:glycosyltransferase family 4 protein [Phycisphaerae bacterium]
MAETKAEAAGPRLVMFLRAVFEFDSRVQKEASSAAQAGFDVTVLCAAGEGLPATERREGFTVRRLGKEHKFGPLSWSMWYLGCIGWCLRHRPHLIHVNDLDPLPAGLIASRLTGAGLVYDSHELWSQGQALMCRGRLTRWLVRKAERFCARRTDANFQADTARAEFFSTFYGLPQPKTLSNCPTYQQCARTNRLREMAGIGPEKKIMLYVGWMLPGRGVESTLQALAYLPEYVHLVFLGQGRHDAIRDFRSSGDQGNRVHVLPPVPYADIVPVVSSVDIGLSLIQNTNLSYYLGVPTKIFEYMMAGVPVVASNFPEISRVVGDVKFGELVDPEDPQQIAQAVMRILENPSLAEEYRRNALEGCKSYCWENQVGSLINEYRRITGWSERP